MDDLALLWSGLVSSEPALLASSPSSLALLFRWLGFGSEQHLVHPPTHHEFPHDRNLTLSVRGIFALDNGQLTSLWPTYT